MELLSLLAFGLFILMLVGLLLFHHHKIPVVVAGFLVMAALFIYQHGFGHFGHHFADEHRSHLLINLALLLPGFALVAHYFEHSGASHGIARVLKTDMLILWAVFVLSTILDNIAACMIGGTIFLARYGQNTPFSLLVGVICASNLGGAGSPVGDTTTVMMYVSKDPIVPVASIFCAFVAAVPAMLLVTAWAVRHDGQPIAVQEVATDGPQKPSIHWGMVMTLLAIPGLVIGNVMDQPGLGLWVGILIGLLIGWTRMNFLEIVKAIPNTFFLVTLVAAAELLPLEAAKPYLAYLSKDSIAVLMGLLSAWFDNIPLTAVCLQLKGFDWGLLAYCVGYGGSAMWFGSSAGVALGLLYKEVYNTRKWLVPFLVVTGSYLVGAAIYLAVFRGVPWVFTLPKFEGMMLCLGLTLGTWAIAGAFEILGKKPRNLTPIVSLGVVGAAFLMLAFVVLAA